MPITDRDLDDLLTVPQAAQIMTISRASVYRLIDARDIDVVRIGREHGRIRITRRAVLDYLNRNVTRAERRRSAS